MVPENSPKCPVTLASPMCRAVIWMAEWAGSMVHRPGGGSSVPAARSRATVPRADPLAVTTAVRAAGEYPGAITIAV